MTDYEKYKTEGIYRKDDDGNQLWESQEFFVKQGELRLIDRRIHTLSFSIGRSRYWADLYLHPTFNQVHEMIASKNKKIKKEKTNGMG